MPTISKQNKTLELVRSEEGHAKPTLNVDGAHKLLLWEEKGSLYLFDRPDSFHKLSDSERIKFVADQITKKSYIKDPISVRDIDKELVIFGTVEDDFIDASGLKTLDFKAYGLKGDDLIVGGKTKNTLFGDDGTDLLLPGEFIFSGEANVDEADLMTSTQMMISSAPNKKNYAIDSFLLENKLLKTIKADPSLVEFSKALVALTDIEKCSLATSKTFFARAGKINLTFTEENWHEYLLRLFDSHVYVDLSRRRKSKAEAGKAIANDFFDTFLYISPQEYKEKYLKEPEIYVNTLKSYGLRGESCVPRKIFSNIKVLSGLIKFEEDFFTKLSTEQKQDGELVSRLFDSNPRIYKHLEPKVLERFSQSDESKEKVLEACFSEKDAIDILGKEYVLKMKATGAASNMNWNLYSDEELAKDPEYQRLVKEFARFGINNVRNFQNPKIANHILANRKDLLTGKLKDEKTLVALFPRQDHNGAFNNSNLPSFFKAGYNILFFEVQNKHYIPSSIKKVGDALRSNLNHKYIDVVFLGGHGSPDSINFGEKENIKPGESDPDMLLKVDDPKMLSDFDLKQYLKPSATDPSSIILYSCLTGYFGKGHKNMANMIAEVFPNSVVYSPRIPSTSIKASFYDKPKLGSDGINLNLEVEFDVPTYVVKPKK